MPYLSINLKELGRIKKENFLKRQNSGKKKKEEEEHKSMNFLRTLGKYQEKQSFFFLFKTNKSDKPLARSLKKKQKQGEVETTIIRDKKVNLQ